MRKLFYPIASCVILVLYSVTSVMAGNNDRAGQAGATELLINPWARSSGFGNANSGSVRGLEAMFMNVAGVAFTKKTEVIFSHTNYFSGSGIKINAVGLAQKAGESGVFALGLMSMDFGEIDITTVDLPEGGIGTFSPQFLNITVSYSKVFSNSIYGGIAVKIIDESISNLNASGIAFDAGIQYVTGTSTGKENIKFGIALKNVGPPLNFGGDGLSFKGTIPSTGSQITVEQRTEKFEMPSLINIGITYDHKFTEMHRLSIAGTFTANSFSNDLIALGLEYSFKEYFMIRGGYIYEPDIQDADLKRTANDGINAGATVEVPFGKSGKTFGFDYAYTVTTPFDGTHRIGVRINL
jgi:hypothetical protein